MTFQPAFRSRGLKADPGPVFDGKVSVWPCISSAGGK